MILTAIYPILKTGEVWNPTDLYKIDMLEPLKEKQKEKAIIQAFKLLRAERLLPLKTSRKTASKIRFLKGFF